MPIIGVSFESFTPDDFDGKKDPSLGNLNRKLNLLYETLNAAIGARGPINLLNHINMNGNRIMNVGAPKETTDALSQTSADPMYSTPVQQSAMEAVGANMLQTTRRLNDGTQQHTVSSDLNTQGSIPPSNVTGMLAFNATGTQIVFTWTGIVIQLSDGSYIAIRNSSLTVTGLAGTTVFSFYPYYDTKLGLLVFVADSVNATGVPPIAFSHFGYSPAAQAQTSDGRIALTSVLMQVTTGGGSGNAMLRSR